MDVTTFGAALRRIRLLRGWSLAGLATELHYSKGHLSRIERGQRRPNEDLARDADTLLAADGRLIALCSGSRTLPTSAGPRTAADQWQLLLAENGGYEFAAVPGGPSEPGAPWQVAVHAAAPGSPVVIGENTTVYRTLFDGLRQFGQVSSPVLVLPALICQLHALRVSMDGQPGPAVLLLAARHAEYAGWMAQESGDDGAALWWTERSAEYAFRVGDETLARYALIRRAELALYRDDGNEVVRLAQTAYNNATRSWLRGVAAQRLAQGLALVGDYDGCRRALDLAAGLAAEVTKERPTLGSTNLPDPIPVMTGWALHDLGHCTEAAGILDREVPRIATGARRVRARYGARQVLAHASIGTDDHLEHACALAGPILDDAMRVDSATIRVDLRRLRSVLAAHLDHPAVRTLYPQLGIALRTAPAHRFRKPGGQ